MIINGSMSVLGFMKEVSFEPVTEWPAVPKPGTFIFKPPRVYICLEINDGVPAWLPMSSDLQTHVHDQFVASDEWLVEHSLNTTGCIVQILSGDGKAITPDDVQFAYNKVTVKFAVPQAGKCILVMGAQEGLPRPQVAYEQVFTDQQVWVVTHNLGYEPIIRAFVGNMEVQPVSIVHSEDKLTTTLSFNSPLSGRVRCI
jgi:hypothetical protein